MGKKLQLFCHFWGFLCIFFKKKQYSEFSFTTRAIGGRTLTFSFEEN